MTPSAAQTQALVASLCRLLPARCIETHISWVLLTADGAYKIKKPVCLPFVDYSTLRARQHFCQEELRLNQRLAPTLYLGVTCITGSAEEPMLDGCGPVLEYAVHMRRFPPGALFSEQLAAGRLAVADVDRLATLLADFHGRAPLASPTEAEASVARRREVALAALDGARPLASAAEHAMLQGWLAAEAQRLRPLWRARQAAGRVRECHGDLHLANVVSLDGGVAAFDGIEFDPGLRWLDVFDDLAFAVMDFDAWGHRALAFRFLNAWLDHTGDHGGLPTLRFAVVYRALVRAQVQYLRGAMESAHRYLATALAWHRVQTGAVQLFITHGLPGSGKTTAAQHLLESQGAIRLRSDVERKRLFGLGMHEDSRARGIPLYDADATQRTYGHLMAVARTVLGAGYPVVLDAAFLRRTERDNAHALARSIGVPWAILACEAPPALLRARLLARQGDASEANLAVLAQLRTQAEPLGADELDAVCPAGPAATAA